MTEASLPATHRSPRENAGMRVVRRLANSRELTLFVLIVLLAGVMTVVYPNNFPTSFNMAAVLLKLALTATIVCGMMLLMIGVLISTRN
jgi:ribose/xylose/arabinose/galactoside ABC-type transport system permease subunit